MHRPGDGDGGMKDGDRDGWKDKGGDMDGGMKGKEKMVKNVLKSGLGGKDTNVTTTTPKIPGANPVTPLALTSTQNTNSTRAQIVK